MINKIMPISKKSSKKLQLARYPGWRWWWMGRAVVRLGRAGWGQWRTAAAWVARGWRRWPFEEEGLCDQIMASGLEKRKKEEGYFGHLMVVYQRSCFNKWFIRTDSTLSVKLFFKPNPIKTY